MDRTIKYILSSWGLLFLYSVYYWYTHLYNVSVMRAMIAQDYNRHSLRYGDDLVRMNSFGDYLFFPFYESGFIGSMCSVMFVCTIGLFLVCILFKLLIYFLNYLPRCKS